MKILLPVDGSPDSMHAVQYALRLVQEGLKAEFVLVNVQEPASLYEVMTARDADVIEQVRSAAGADLLASAQALLQQAGVPWESEVAGGDPARVLVELIESHGCDAVIMGTHGAGSLRNALVGSVSDAVLQHSPVPVTVVRVPAAEEAAEAAEDAG